MAIPQPTEHRVVSGASRRLSTVSVSTGAVTCFIGDRDIAFHVTAKEPSCAELEARVNSGQDLTAQAVICARQTCPGMEEGSLRVNGNAEQIQAILEALPHLHRTESSAITRLALSDIYELLAPPKTDDELIETLRALTDKVESGQRLTSFEDLELQEAADILCERHAHLDKAASDWCAQLAPRTPRTKHRAILEAL